MIRILNVEPAGYSDEARRVLREVGSLDERSLTYEGIISCIGEYDVLIVRLRWRVDRRMLDAASRLKVIVSATTGIDHIDVESASERDICVLSLKGQTDFLDTVVATAEHTWALLLALSRRIPWASQSVAAGHWQRDHFRGHDLRGRRLGIVGLGRVGEKVARYGIAFGMNVSAFDPYTERRVPAVTMRSSLKSLLEHADVLSVHVPLNGETRRMLGPSEFELLPSGALLINTSRGAVLDEEALVNALNGGRLAGAALDVVEGELSPLAGAPLIRAVQRRNDLIITPHIAGATYEAMASTELYMALQLRTFLRLSLARRRPT